MNYSIDFKVSHRDEPKTGQGSGYEQTDFSMGLKSDAELAEVQQIVNKAVGEIIALKTRTVATTKATKS